MEKDGGCIFYHNTLRTLTANRHIESHIFCEIRLRTNNIVYARFEVFRTFLCIFISVFRNFECEGLSVTVPVVIFFGVVDSIVPK